MKTSSLKFLFLAAVGCGVVVGTLWAQPPGRTKKGPDANRYQPKGDGENKPKDEKPRPLPADPKLVKLHETFVLNAEKLATEYLRDGKMEQARTCFEEILHLVPSYSPAREAMDKIRQREAVADKKKLKVYANKDWQDAGINIVKGKPISIHAEGTWTFKLAFQLGPAGIEIPERLRDFNLGSLVGVVTASDPNAKDAKPFLVGNAAQFTAEENGRLYLRMFDSEVEDNTGDLSVEITGTFGK
jgi:hypothetical protein